MRSLGALARFPDVDLCLRTFDLAMTEVRSQNGFAVIGSLLANPSATRRSGPGSTETWDAVLDRFPKNAPPRILESIPALCGDAEFADGPSHSSTPTRSSSGRAGWPSRSSGCGSMWPSASRERAGLADSLRAAGAPTA